MPCKAPCEDDRVASDPLDRRLRAVVNNAAIAMNAPVETLPIDEWRRLFEVNLFATSR